MHTEDVSAAATLLYAPVAQAVQPVLAPAYHPTPHAVHTKDVAAAAIVLNLPEAHAVQHAEEDWPASAL